MQTIKAGLSSAREMPAKASEKVEVVLEVTRSALYMTIVVTLTLALLTFVSVFMYGTFYFAFVPSPEHQGEVYPLFEACQDVRGKCGFLNGSVALSDRQRAVLMTGQAYTIALSVEMPESPVNRDLGMFMNCVQLKSEMGKVIQESCKSSMMQYRSELLRVIETFVFAPILLTGYSTEKQWVHIEFFNAFMDDPLTPVVRLDYQINSRYIEVYQVRYTIHANFSGLRYLMFHYPVTSAVIGSWLNLIFLSILILLSWYRFFSPPPNESIAEIDSLFQTEDAKTEIVKDEKKFSDSEEDFQVLSKGVEEIAETIKSVKEEEKEKDLVTKKLD